MQAAMVAGASLGVACQGTRFPDTSREEIGADMTATPENRLPGSAQDHRGRRRLGRVARRTLGTMRHAGATATAFLMSLPGTARATQRGARTTTSALQVLPDSTLRGLAASSIGLGAGTYLARGPRLLTAAVVAPAFVIGAAIILRPNDATPAVASG
jgi:hypothetical protein